MSTQPPTPWGQAGSYVAPLRKPQLPGPLKAAVILMYVGAGLRLFGILFVWSARDELEDLNSGFGSTMTSEEFQSGLNSYIVMGFIEIGIWIWMAIMNRNGKNWARITATVFAGLGLIISLYTFSELDYDGLYYSQEQADTLEGFIGWAKLTSLGTIILAASIVLLMYQRVSSDYYDDRSRPSGPPYGGPPPPQAPYNYF